VAALLAKRPPAQWSDAELPGFELALADLARRFRAVEELALAAGAAPPDSGLLRIGIANGGGELSRVLPSIADDPAAQGLRAELEGALGRHAGLSAEQRAAALAALLHSLLAPGEPEQTHNDRADLALTPPRSSLGAPLPRAGEGEGGEGSGTNSAQSNLESR
jgi:hypothetical protein